MPCIRSCICVLLKKKTAADFFGLDTNEKSKTERKKKKKRGENGSKGKKETEPRLEMERTEGLGKV